jgi:hypothetical protein
MHRTQTPNPAAATTASYDYYTAYAIILLLLLSTAAISHAAELRIGLAAIVITPPVGTPLAGYYETASPTPFTMISMPKSSSSNAAATARPWFPATSSACRSPSQEAHRLIEQQTGLKPDQVMISATHAHTGPILPGQPPAKPAMAPAAISPRNMSSNCPENRRRRQTGHRQTRARRRLRRRRS